jgi:DNA-binding transcriptional regulator YhcF (GntR family)
MSCEAVKWVLHNSKAKGSARLVLLSIAEHSDRHGERAWPSYARLAREAGVNYTTVWRSIEILERLDEIEIVRGGGRTRTNHYRMKWVSSQMRIPFQAEKQLHGATVSDGKKQLHLRGKTVAPCNTNSPEPPLRPNQPCFSIAASVVVGVALTPEPPPPIPKIEPQKADPWEEARARLFAKVP